MSWYRDSDGKIITDEEFQSDCCECSAFCSEGKITAPCDGERADCPHFKKVDTSDYDKKIRNKAIDEFAETLNNKISEFVLRHKDNLDFASGIAVAWNIVDEIAEKMKEVGE